MKRSEIKRRSPVKRVNPARRKRLFAEDFGSKDYVEYLHALPCAICEVYGWTVAAHLTSRGAGGKVDDLAPLCNSRLMGTAEAVPGCHQLYDAHDPAVRAHEPRLRALAKSLRRAWLDQEQE